MAFENAEADARETVLPALLGRLGASQSAQSTDCGYTTDEDADDADTGAASCLGRSSEGSGMNCEDDGSCEDAALSGACTC